MIKQNNGCRRQSKLLPSKANPWARHGLMLLLLLFMSMHVTKAQTDCNNTVIQRARESRVVLGSDRFSDNFYSTSPYEMTYSYDVSSAEEIIFGFQSNWIRTFIGLPYNTLK